MCVCTAHSCTIYTSRKPSHACYIDSHIHGQALSDWGDGVLKLFHSSPHTVLSVVVQHNEIAHSLPGEGLRWARPSRKPHVTSRLKSPQRGIGVMIDKFSEHLTQKINKDNNFVGLIRRTFVLGWGGPVYCTNQTTIGICKPSVDTLPGKRYRSSGTHTVESKWAGTFPEELDI